MKAKRKLSYIISSFGYHRDLKDGFRTFERAKTFDQAFRKAKRMQKISKNDVMIDQRYLIGKNKGKSRTYIYRYKP